MSRTGTGRSRAGTAAKRPCSGRWLPAGSPPTRHGVYCRVIRPAGGPGSGRRLAHGPGQRLARETCGCEGCASRGADVNEMERIWREKTDEQLRDAASSLDEYTEEGRQVILAELERRGLDPPEPGEMEELEEGDGESLEEGGEAGEESEALTCLRCDVELTYLGSKDVHGSKHAGVLGDIGDLFEGTEKLHVYVCPRCGHVEFFASPEASERQEHPEG